MKTFTAQEFLKQPAQVYVEAMINGSAKINHGNYPSKVFVLTAEDRRKDLDKESTNEN